MRDYTLMMDVPEQPPEKESPFSRDVRLDEEVEAAARRVDPALHIPVYSYDDVARIRGMYEQLITKEFWKGFWYGAVLVAILWTGYIFVTVLS